MSKQLLGDYISAQMRERNETGVSVAEDLDLPPTTLKSWLNRNSYPVEGLKLLAERYRLPLSVAELQQRFDFKLARAYARVGAENSPVEAVDEAKTIDTARHVILTENDWNWKERQVEKDALALFRLSAKSGLPIPIGILGGPRTGKSTALRYIRDNAHEHAAKLVLDFQSAADQFKDDGDGPQQFLEAIDRAVLQLYPDAPRLRNLHHLPRWLSKVKADFVGLGRLLIALDGLEHLPQSVYTALSTALHYLKNGMSTFSELRQIDIIYSYDPIVQEIQGKNSVGSRFIGSYGIRIDTQAIQERAASGLIEALLARNSGADQHAPAMANNLATVIYDELTHGHPWLLQCCLAALQEALTDNPQLAVDEAQAKIRGAFERHFNELIVNNRSGADSEPNFELDGSTYPNRSIWDLKGIIRGTRRSSSTYGRESITDSNGVAAIAISIKDGPTIGRFDAHSPEPDGPDLQTLRQSLLFYDHEPHRILTTMGIAKALGALPNIGSVAS